ncbi:hypothetical protein B0H15DRAFT_505459 [Mycena belliarum]|uniref:Uncharacterized protein n=1 Tax=Mycena belliarum TaxID=1033014 RepID=A0AAD6UGV4_9AGAR|nr:hypothetical protein B0H15DRAFT_505459 [Mycena belliae]
MNDFAPTASIVLASVADALPMCNLCHKAPVSSRMYVTCRSCRDKRSANKRQAKLAVRMALLRAGGFSTNLPPPLAGSSSVVKSLKRKADEESSTDVMERMRKRLKTMKPFAAKSEAPTPVASVETERAFVKFINAAELYKDMKRHQAIASPSMHFYGTYAIVALPTIDNKERARAVARDLRANTSLHFDPEDRKSMRSNDANNTYTIRYKCTCHAAPSALKRSSSGDISSYFAKTAPKAEEKPKATCKGRIEISAEDDKSHRLGWLGQRVKVTVYHPKKA